eukprot:10276878-Heterocapsa_arctica.AAC.1
MATRSTQQTIMIGDYDSMTSKHSSPQVRACLKTLKSLGAVFDAPCTDKFNNAPAAEVIEEVWPRMLASRGTVRTGSVEEHADHAWNEAVKCAVDEGLNKPKHMRLPYKVAAFGRLTQGPHNNLNGTSRQMGDEGFIVRNGPATEVISVQDQGRTYDMEEAFSGLICLKQHHAADDMVALVMTNLPANRLWTTVAFHGLGHI